MQVHLSRDLQISCPRSRGNPLPGLPAWFAVLGGHQRPGVLTVRSHYSSCICSYLRSLFNRYAYYSFSPFSMYAPYSRSLYSRYMLIIPSNYSLGVLIIHAHCSEGAPQQQIIVLLVMALESRQKVSFRPADWTRQAPAPRARSLAEVALLAIFQR